MSRDFYSRNDRCSGCQETFTLEMTDVAVSCQDFYSGNDRCSGCQDTFTLEITDVAVSCQEIFTLKMTEVAVVKRFLLSK